MQSRIISVGAPFSRKRARGRLTGEINETIALGWEPLGRIAGRDANQVPEAMGKRR
ncbi:MAG TPA: hypothetical protein VLT83_05740 [Opitutaceae bacterium]|nr:hypothetical protein [Opitutaceae bacterium]